MTDLLAIYDGQLRTSAEVAGAERSDTDGPLWRALFARGGFVSYHDLAGLQGDDLDALIARTIAHFRDETDVEEFEWKTRGHDAPVDLGERLVAAGFVAEPEETVMMGEAALLTDAPDLAPVVVRRVDNTPDCDRVVTEAAVLQRSIFGAGPSPEQVLARLARDPANSQFWVAEASDAGVIGAGRLELVVGTDVAGLWGGATHPDWRGRGVYRALTAARAAATLEAGYRYLHSDCTEMSRPILERSGLTKVTTTTPYVWRRR